MVGRQYFAVLGFLLLASCGEAVSTMPDGSFSGAPLLIAGSDAGLLHLELRSSPQPPVRGTVAFRLTVTDGKGEPVDGLNITVQPWMPDMGHGSSLKPVITVQGGGVYDITNVVLFMAGRWQLRTTFDGPVRDSAAPAFQID